MTGVAGLSIAGLSANLSSCGNKSKATAPSTPNEASNGRPFFKISLAQWSLHKTFFGDALKNGFGAFVQTLQTDPDALLRGTEDPVNFPAISKNRFGIDAVEYVNTFYFSKARDLAFWKEMKKRCDDEGVRSVLIMCDALGDLGNLDEAARIQAVENHYPWVDNAKSLGCHAIRVNAAGQGTAEEVMTAAVDGLGRLTEYGAQNEINIIVENHGGHSSNGMWLASVMDQVNSPFCGTLPDFGNFCVEHSPEYECLKTYDAYKGVAELMPYAKGVSAKTHNFDEDGNETDIDYRRMLKIVKDAGYTGYIDVEYEGPTLSEEEGIKATKALLERVGSELS